MFDGTVFPGQCEARKSTRRADLTTERRLQIAFMALQGPWGIVTHLARSFEISRTFIYTMKHELQRISEEVFGETKKVGHEWIRQRVIVLILCLRLEGRCSISGISQILRRLGITKYSSTGTVSEILQLVGEQLPNSLVNDGQTRKLVIMACDELFSHLRPILLTVEPVSTAILRIELADTREVQAWKQHWECIERNGYTAVYLVNDEGTGMSAAQKEALCEVVRQSDTFHGVAHRLGVWVHRLERAAYQAIEYEKDRLDRLQTAKSARVRKAKRSEYRRAKQAAQKAIECYESFHYLYGCLIGTLQVFDRDGTVNQRQRAEATVCAALDLMSDLEIGSVEKELKSIRRLLPDLFSYLDEAARIVEQLRSSSEISEDLLQGFCAAWQYQKNWIKAKQPRRRNYYKSREHEQLQLLEGELGDRFGRLKQTVYLQLDHIVQSSAMIENINSILRMYLNATKNHVTQPMLNLFMHYHNYRRYVAGKRKGKSPLEMLTGNRQQKDWLELLLEIVPWEQSNLLKPAA